MTIDQNTDTDFFKKASCLLITIFKGRVSIDGSGICIETPNTYGLINSQVNIVVIDQETIITVLSGNMTLKRPFRKTLHRSQQAHISAGRIQSIRLLSERNLQSVFHWLLSPGRGESGKVRCRIYAETAISQQKENLRRRCRFSGKQWSTDFRHHYQWCMKVPKAKVDAETRARAEALKHKCAPAHNADKKQRCRIYAETAVSQQEENARRKCRFKGNEWSLDFNHHYQWCLKVPKAKADAETRARTEALKHKCVSAHNAGKKQRCRIYAETAVSQQEENAHRGCRLRGHRWSNDFSRHYQWCLQVPQSQADSETRARDKSLKKCQKPGPVIY